MHAGDLERIALSPWFKLKNKVGKRSQISSFALRKRAEVCHVKQAAISSAPGGREGSGFGCASVSNERSTIRRCVSVPS